VTINGSPRGAAPDALPYYLLIYANPTDVPWELQYILNSSHCVGRLDLQGQELENYVGALLTDWNGIESQWKNPVIWSTIIDNNDITGLMRNSIAAPLNQKLAADKDVKPTFLDGGPASSGDNLIEALAANHPSLIVRTSHWMTGPLNDLETLRGNLGLPVDGRFRQLDTAALLKEWSPAGAFWYAHACCSAGSDSRSTFAGLLPPESDANRILEGVSRLGAMSAVLPRRLLGAKQPLRAFIGHVEPTFDWTLKQSLTGQFLTDPILKALWDGLYNRVPVGFAFRDWYSRFGEALVQYGFALALQR
jgi:hypothetical protein